MRFEIGTQWELPLTGRNGHHGPDLDPGGLSDEPFLAVELASATAWLRNNSEHQHSPGCQCQRCVRARSVTRSAAAHCNCVCGWCVLCWASQQIKRGRL